MADQNDPRLGELFTKLALSNGGHEIAAIEDAIWRIWLTTEDAAVDQKMAEGARAMERRDFGGAKRAFDSVVESDPDFAEGWNKRATLFYLAGRFEESIADIERTLALEPRHFGALSGLAMIREQQSKPFAALEALERLMQVHPKLPHLGERVDRLTSQLGDPI